MKPILIAAILALGACATAPLPVPAMAQETRVAPEDHIPPPATLDEVDWLVGQWLGEGIAGAPAMESWLPPIGGTMVGTFVQTKPDGTIMFTEHMYLMEEDGTLVLRLKHFNADLTGWEEKDKMLTFRLIALEDCAAYFRSLTLRCDGEDGLLAAVRMKSDGDAVKELIFRFERAIDNDIPDCAAYGTNSYMTCFGLALDYELGVYQSLRDMYRNELASTDDALASFEASEETFESYVFAECGSPDSSENLLCRLRLTRDRIRTLRQNWLVP